MPAENLLDGVRSSAVSEGDGAVLELGEEDYVGLEARHAAAVREPLVSLVYTCESAKRI